MTARARFDGTRTPIHACRWNIMRNFRLTRPLKGDQSACKKKKTEPRFLHMHYVQQRAVGNDKREVGNEKRTNKTEKVFWEEQKDFREWENTVLEHNLFNVQPQLSIYRESEQSQPQNACKGTQRVCQQHLEPTCQLKLQFLDLLWSRWRELNFQLCDTPLVSKYSVEIRFHVVLECVFYATGGEFCRTSGSTEFSPCGVEVLMRTDE